MKISHPLKKNSTRNNAKSNLNTSSNPSGFTPALTALLALVSADVKALQSTNKADTQQVIVIVINVQYPRKVHEKCVASY